MRRNGGRVIRATCCVVIVCITLELYLLLPASLVCLSPKSEHVSAPEKYRVRQFVSVGDRWQQLAASAGDWATCLALHASLSHVHHVGRQARFWSGPLSVALFAAGDDVRLLLAYVTFLRRCRQHVRDRVSFHLLWPSEQPPNDTVAEEWDKLEGADCGQDEEQVLQRLLQLQAHPVGEQLSYPQNLARNTARLACPTRLTLCPDADMLSPAGFDVHAALAELFSRQPPCTRCAYVLPVFEMDSRQKHVPRDKTELRQLALSQQVRPYHWTVYRRNQRCVQPARWLFHESNASQLNIAYEMPYEWKAEPVFVATSEDLPLFDETFVGYGFTRNTQAYEMFASGWRFFVLDNAFLVHFGFQSTKQRPKWRQRQMADNYGLLRKWAHRVAVHGGSDPLRLARSNRERVTSTTRPKYLCCGGGEVCCNGGAFIRKVRDPNMRHVPAVSPVYMKYVAVRHFSASGDPFYDVNWKAQKSPPCSASHRQSRTSQTLQPCSECGSERARRRCPLCAASCWA
ncbi:beta-1,4-glucuronyltransferase 1-like isoform X2 [Schistocerca gregaria]|uniref:beta-1,4-glucuronyltransferase 1-like isoform X2 n=1 Tax=Schistocerca gregaria TaxID=7010 RepID=UPI00211E252B|nr:beta-1,4-glucuronyltransferase 1-like isoform X2 [Schistocerca gregaria]